MKTSRFIIVHRLSQGIWAVFVSIYVRFVFIFFKWPLRIKARDNKCCVTIGGATSWIYGRVTCFQERVSSGTNHTLKICPLNKHPSKQQSNHIPNCISPHQKICLNKFFPYESVYCIFFIFLVKNLKHTRTNIGYATGKTILHPKKTNKFALKRTPHR